MGLALLIVILAVIFGGVGLLVDALQWALVIALVLLVAGAFLGLRARRSLKG